MPNFVCLVYSIDHNYYIVGVTPKIKRYLLCTVFCVSCCCQLGPFFCRLHSPPQARLCLNAKWDETRFEEKMRTHMLVIFQRNKIWFLVLIMDRKCCSQSCSLCSVKKRHEIRPTKRTIIMFFHPFQYTRLMKNVIALISLCPAYGLARFVCF